MREKKSGLNKPRYIMDSQSKKSSAKSFQITVHMGTCGRASGAGEIYQIIQDEIKNGLKKVTLTQSGCAGLCSREPMLTVREEGKPPLVYADMTPGRVKRVLNEHILKGKPVREFLLGMGCETLA